MAHDNEGFYGIPQDEASALAGLGMQQLLPILLHNVKNLDTKLYTHSRLLPHRPWSMPPSRSHDAGGQVCPPAFDCNGVAPQYWHPNNFL